MQSKATHTHHYVRYGLLAMVLLLLGTSQDAFAQDRILQQHQALEAAAEEAKEQGIMNRAVDTFREFEEQNREAVREAMRAQGMPYASKNAGVQATFPYEVSTTTFSFINATAGMAAKTNGILVAVGDDASSMNSGIFAPVALGTAPFNFYGVEYNSLVPATNGYISTSAADGGPDLSNDCPIPSALSSGAGGRLYPLHDDMVAGGGSGSPTGGIFWEYFPSCPHPHSSGGCDVFHYNDANHFANFTDFFDYEVILFANNDIIYQYAAGNPEQGSGSTTGVQNPAADDATQFSCNTFGSITDNLAILFEFPDLTEADLEIAKSVNDAAPDLGDVVTFTIDVTNNGPGAPISRVNDLLPDGLAYDSHLASQGSYNAATGEWQVGSLAIGATATLTIDAEVEASGTVTNTAFVAFANLVDPDPSNNTASATLNPVAADLALLKRVTDFDSDGTTISATFMLTVVNQGPNNTCGVEVTDYLSPDMTLASVSGSQGVVVATPPTIGWGVGCLDVGDSATLTAVVSAPADGNLTNSAEVTAADLPDPDSTPGDGEGDDYALATASARAVADFVPEGGPGGIINRGDRYTADLKVDKSADVSTAAVGATVTWTIDVTNQGPQSTAKVVVTDDFPSCLGFESATADRGSFDPTTLEWSVGDLKVDETVSLTVVSTVGADCAGTVTNTAEVTASSLPDPDDQFNLFDEENEQDEVGSASFDVEANSRELNGQTFALGGNYPNPFNPDTVVPFSLAASSYVTVKVYDLLGRSVATLVDSQMSAGIHEVRFEASHLPTGTYLVRMEAAGKVYTQRLTLMK